MELLRRAELSRSRANLGLVNVWEPSQLAGRLSITLGQACRLRAGKGKPATSVKALAFLRPCGLEVASMCGRVARFDRQKLKQAREAAKLPPTELARRAGLREGPVSAFERSLGKAKPARVKAMAEGLAPGTRLFLSGGRMEAEKTAQR